MSRRIGEASTDTGEYKIEKRALLYTVYTREKNERDIGYLNAGMTTHDLGSAHGDAYVNEARRNVPKQRVAKTADDGTVNDFGRSPRQTCGLCRKYAWGGLHK